MPNCPECSTPNAYVGFMVVECLNPQCRHYVLAHGASGQSNQAFIAASPLPPATQAVVDDFMANEFQREIELIQNAVGNPIPVTMDFRNVGRDVKAVRLLIRVLHRVRATLCLRSGHYKEALRSGIQRVAIRHTGPGERKSCTLAQGVLDMIVCIDDQKTHSGPNGVMEYDEDDVDLMVADALDLELGPAIRRLQEWLLGCIAEANEALRLQIKLDVDWKSFTSNPDNRINLQTIGRLETEFHQHILYWLRSHAANDKEFRKQLKKVLHSVRLEHVSSAAQRELFVDGTTIVYRLCLTEDNGAWGYELGDVLMAAVMSVQPAPSADDVKLWMEEQGEAMRQRIAAISDSAARAVLEKFLERDLPASALRIQTTVGYPVELDLDWETLSRSLAIVSHVIPRVLNRVCGALAMVAKNEAHELLLQEGSLERIAISFTQNAAAKTCVFDAPVLKLTVCVEQPGAGCFDENEMATTLNAKLAVESRLDEIKEKVPKTTEWLCETLGTWIDFEVEWDGFLALTDSGKLQLTLMELGNVGLDWVYYALTGQCEESADFKSKLFDRVRAIRYIHAPNPKAKSITAEGSTLVYRLFLHDGYDGRFIIDHLKEIFEEVVETMAPGAPPSQKVIDELDRCEANVIPAMQSKIAKVLCVDVAIKIDRASIGNNLGAARQLGTAGLKSVLDAIVDLARNKDVRKRMAVALKTITVRAADTREGNRCVFKEGELLVETCLDATGSNALSQSDIYNTLQESLAEPERDEVECDERGASQDYSDRDPESDDDEESDVDADQSQAMIDAFRQLRLQGLDKIVGMYNQMFSTSVVLDGDWDAFEDALKSPDASEVQQCVFSTPQMFLAAILQLSMLNPPLGQRLRGALKVIRFACARPKQAKEIKLESGVLTCRMKVEDGAAGGFDQNELLAGLQNALAAVP